VVVVRQNISVQKGEQVLFDEIQYFFCITTLEELAADQIVGLAHERCDQENVIEQLKNGVNAMRMPVDDLLSNWAYMVMRRCCVRIGGVGGSSCGWNFGGLCTRCCWCRRKWCGAGGGSCIGCWGGRRG
jgi:hypothetical protein